MTRPKRPPKGMVAKRTIELQVATRLAKHLDWPGMAQVCRLTRRTRRDGKETIETQYAITSVSRDRADARQLLTWWRQHWDIENRLHWVRDTAFREDHCRVGHSNAAHNLAAFRNAAINLLRLQGATNITAALRQNAYRIDQLLSKLGILKK